MVAMILVFSSATTYITSELQTFIFLTIHRK